MGAGKSSVGAALARELGFPFVELDTRIETREGRAISRIFQESGEPVFRKIEHHALRDFLSENHFASHILALGGGAFVQPENAKLIQEKACVTIFLDAPPEELFQRCSAQNSGRPLQKDFDDFRNLYEARRARYLAATLRIETNGKTVEAVVAEVACGLGLRN